jgi:N-acetylmuramoyl-L-alanine amidase
MTDRLILDGEFLWLKQSAYLWILDFGHGGIDAKGHYTTAPAKMFKFENGLTMYEGAINRAIGGMVKKALLTKRIDYAIVADEVEDTPLEERVRRADSIYGKDKRAVYLSIHSNAGGGTGWELFTGPGQTDSDKIVRVFERFYRDMGKAFKFRGVKDENFYVLRKTDCPAILVENLFFDNINDAQFLISAAGQQHIADIIVAAILACEVEKPI